MPTYPGDFAQRVLAIFARPDGLGAVEFGFLAPILLMLTVCVIDLGNAAYDAMQVEAGAQAGSEYAAVHGYNVASIESAVTAASRLSGLAASPAPAEFCACPTSSGSALTTVTCGSTCSDGSLAGTYVTVSATATYTTFIHYPALPPKFTFVNNATTRIQ